MIPRHSPKAKWIITSLSIFAILFQLSASHRILASLFSKQHASTTVAVSASGLGASRAPSSANSTRLESDENANPKAPNRIQVRVAPTKTTFSTSAAEASTSNEVKCPTEGSSEPPIDIVVSKSAVFAQSKSRLEELKQYTVPQYEKYFLEDAGKNHYTLLKYLTKEYNKDNRCHVVDIGTRYVASALAFGATGTPVWTFDRPASRERYAAFRNQSPESWNDKLEYKEGVHIKFHNLNLLTVPDEEFRKYMSTWLIMLDTAHLPYSKPFEREFFDRLLGMDFKGILVLDDIHLRGEMSKWWKELKEMASTRGRFTLHDLTSIGHGTGTGVVDFSGKFKLVD